MSWKMEMLDTDGRWITNGLRFGSKEEAEAYGQDLRSRWMAMPEHSRAAESSDPVRDVWPRHAQT